MYDEWEDEEYERIERFADPYGDSALYAADEDNPRNLPCTNCGWPNRLTPKDVAQGYQCNSCAEALERGLDIIPYYEDEGEDDGE
jgi:hypothetical protein